MGSKLPFAASGANGSFGPEADLAEMAMFWVQRRAYFDTKVGKLTFAAPRTEICFTDKPA